jgi:stage II sporulation protein R
MWRKTSAAAKNPPGIAGRMYGYNTHCMNTTSHIRPKKAIAARKKWRIRRAAMLILMAALMLAAFTEPPPLRLHVIAHSDSAADQRAKFMVRDAVLKVTEEGILNCKNAGEAEEYIRSHLGIIVATANEVLESNRLPYKASASMGVSRFPEREYRGVDYPEGNYKALRIVLGEGNGQNWWCVMFPPLCLSEVGVDVDEVQYTSFFAELYHSLFSRP